MTMLIGIDPGPKESAYAHYDGERVFGFATISNEELVLKLSLIPAEISVAIEWIVGYGLTVGSETFEPCRWVGRFEQAAGGAMLISRKEIKSHLCSSTQAKDTHVRQALMDRIGPPGTKKAPGPTYGLKGHEWAALAVAVTAWDRRK